MKIYRFVSAAGTPVSPFLQEKHRIPLFSRRNSCRNGRIVDFLFYFPVLSRSTGKLFFELSCKKRHIFNSAKSGDLIYGSGGIFQIPARLIEFQSNEIRYGGGIVPFPEKFRQSILCCMELIEDTFQIFIFFRRDG